MNGKLHKLEKKKQENLYIVFNYFDKIEPLNKALLDIKDRIPFFEKENERLKG
jgi:hypothetical protein